MASPSSFVNVDAESGIGKNLDFSDSRFGEMDGKNMETYTIDDADLEFDTAESKLLSAGGEKPGGEEDEEKKLTTGTSSSAFWTFSFYQKLFDVDTRQVMGRLLGSMFPRPHTNFLQMNVRPNPDLYGPVWVSFTLIFTIAIMGNMANYFQHDTHQPHHWHYDFNKVTISATVILSYAFAVPCTLYAFLWWRGNPANYTLMETVCVYGYSLTVFVPISILWVIQVSWLQWLLVLVGMVLSGGVLVLTFWPAVSHADKKAAMLVVGAIIALHALLAVGFMLYFFHVPAVTSISKPKLTTTAGAPPSFDPVKPAPDSLRKESSTQINADVDKKPVMPQEVDKGVSGKKEETIKENTPQKPGAADKDANQRTIEKTASNVDQDSEKNKPAAKRDDTAREQERKQT